MTQVNNFVENGGCLCWMLVWSVSVDVDPNAPKKFPKLSVFFREVTPDSPSPRKPHINQGVLRKWLGKVKCLCGVFLVCSPLGVCGVCNPSSPTGVSDSGAKGRLAEDASKGYVPASLQPQALA